MACDRKRIKASVVRFASSLADRKSEDQEESGVDILQLWIQVVSRCYLLLRLAFLRSFKNGSVRANRCFLRSVRTQRPGRWYRELECTSEDA